MTGPEHYAEAERLLAALGERDGVPAHQHAAVVAVAEVHATLAQTAALIEALGNSLGGSLLSDVPDPTEPFVMTRSPWARVLQ